MACVHLSLSTSLEEESALTIHQTLETETTSGSVHLTGLLQKHTEVFPEPG